MEKITFIYVGNLSNNFLYRFQTFTNLYWEEFVIITLIDGLAMLKHMTN